MEDDNIAVDGKVNNEIIDLCRFPHRYMYGNTLDKMLPDYNIKKIWKTISPLHLGSLCLNMSKNMLQELPSLSAARLE